MALYYTLPVYRDTYRLILAIFEATRKFPREYKYTLGQDMKRDGLVLIRSIYRANKNRDKQRDLETFQDDLELLKLQIRLAYDMRIISVKKQVEIIEIMDVIGRQVSGWKKAGSSARIVQE
ncbi:four helix bundle protein [Patescibacteria group bacterium]|nr:four helix bundle protein [Patescibacteria group bacterium]